MNEKLLGAGILIQIVACTVVGTRLVALSIRTRLAPELLYGAAFLFLGTIGHPMAIAARNGTGGPEVAGWLLATALCAQDLAALSMGAATWRTFRPLSKVLGPLHVLWAIGFAISLIGHGMTVGFKGASDGGAFYYMGFALRYAAFVWTSIEAFRYHAILRRRQILGLADPVVLDRIRLWAWASLLICAGFATFLAGRLATSNVGESPLVLVVTSIVAVGAGSTMWLAFFPPSFYLAYVRRIAEQPVPTA